MTTGGEKTILRPPPRHGDGAAEAPVSGKGDTVSSKEDQPAFEPDASVVSWDATQQFRSKVATTDYSVASSVSSKQHEEADGMKTSLRPPLRTLHMDEEVAKDSNLPVKTESLDYSKASLETTRQYGEASAAARHERQASNDLVAREPTLLPQILPGAVAVSGINSVAESDQIFDIDVESRHSNVSDAEGIVTAYTVDDHVHEAELVNVKKQCLYRFIWAAATVIIIVAVVVPIIVLTGKDGSSSDKSKIQFSSIIMNLCSPRHLKVYEDKLFVVEAGVRPRDMETSNLCLESLLLNDDSLLCFGKTGQVSVFYLDGSRAGEPRLTGLVSGRSPDVNTNQVYGALAVDFDKNGTMFTLVGLGFVNAKELASRDPDLVFASILRGDKVVASPWVPLHEINYANVSVVETNPFH